MKSSDMLKCREGVAVMPPRLFPEPCYYAVAAAYGSAAVAGGRRYNKRDKAVHRYAIADTRGRLDLTVPIVHPAGSTSAEGVPWSSVQVSAHGQWWEVHRTALESSYGRTPFFEYYIGRLEPLLAPHPSGHAESAIDLCTAANAIVASILDLSPITACDVTAPTEDIPACPAIPYWQLRADSLGFIPGLSILDLIFNLGPEAALYLLELQRALGLRK